MLRLADRRWAAQHTSFGNKLRKADHWVPASPARSALQALGAAIALAALLALAVLLALAIPDGAHADTIYYTYALRWTAPGDDGAYGRAKAYELRFSLSPISESTWINSTHFPGMPAPAAPGTKETFTIFGLDARNDYYVAMKTVDEQGNWSKLSNVLTVHSPQPVGSPGDSTRIALSSPWPNPASSEARFAYELPRSGPVEIDALDVTGRRVKTLASGTHGAGRGMVLWDLNNDRGGRIAPGIYMIRARLLNLTVTRRLVVAR